jgi:hypothetical protein
LLPCSAFGEATVHATTTIDHPRRLVAWPWRWGRRAALALGAVVLLVAVLVAASFFIDEPMRRHMESALNASMKGYTVRLPELHFHPLGFSLTLRGLSVRQNAHPEPPVLVLDALDAGVHWRALLHLRLVADFEFQSPRIHIDRRQLMTEAKDKVPVKDKGWEQALEQIYPLKINHFQVSDASVTYIDTDPKSPLRITDANIVATNIRNVSSPDHTYPSPFHVDAVIFQHGRVAVDGKANFLAEPDPAMQGHVDIGNVPLQELKPVTSHANVAVTSGTLGAAGDFEYSAKAHTAHLQHIDIDDLAVDYTHARETAGAEAHRAEEAKQVAKETADHPTAEIKVDDLTLRRATLGYVDHTVDPGYRVFLRNATIRVRDFSNQSAAGPTKVSVQGAFEGSGDLHLDATFVPRQDNPDLTVALRIEHTELRDMNDLLHSYANFDVVGGTFSFYTELQVKNGTIEGYVKPFFTDMNVYDRRQDRDKPILKQAYEALVGGVSALLENRREAVATQTHVSGSTGSPKVSTWEVVVNLVRNAFFRAILPGFEQSVRERSGGTNG